MIESECAFCGDSRVTHEHHVVPRRFGGHDSDDNLLTLCPTCHAIVEETYDDAFYNELGVKKYDEDRVRTDAILQAARKVAGLSASDLNADANWSDPIEQRKTRRYVLEAQVECLMAIVDLLDGYDLCVGCERPTPSDECPTCGTLNGMVKQ